MDANADRLAFAPPEQPGLLSGFALAVMAHLLLMIALTWGITWNHETENLSVEAELWASTPQQAAPRLVEPPPPAVPTPAPVPPVTRKAEAAPPPAPTAPTAREPDIAIEREKKKQQLAKQRQEELERQKKLEARQKLEDMKREQLAAQKQEQERKKKEDLAKAAKAEKAQQAERQQREDEKRTAALRAEQLARMQGLARATGGPSATGAAERSSGPSDGYAGRVRARVRPNIVFTDDIAGNPTAEVEVRLSPDGTITSRRVLKSSGVRSWDDAVLRALDKTEVLPRDVDGRVPPHLLIEFKPRS